MNAFARTDTDFTSSYFLWSPAALPLREVPSTVATGCPTPPSSSNGDLPAIPQSTKEFHTSPSNTIQKKVDNRVAGRFPDTPPSSTHHSPTAQPVRVHVHHSTLVASVAPFMPSNPVGTVPKVKGEENNNKKEEKGSFCQRPSNVNPCINRATHSYPPGFVPHWTECPWLYNILLQPHPVNYIIKMPQHTVWDRYWFKLAWEMLEQFEVGPWV